MEKSREAFRTISEVAEWLDVPTHVLRFWESRFSQIKPVKRAGGRRYYRPSDMRVIGGVKTLLHDQGMTIRGVQKLLREQGIKHVSSFSPSIYGAANDDDDSDTIDHRETEAPANEPAVPAQAARSTREATPAPAVDEIVAKVDQDDAAIGVVEVEEIHVELEESSEAISDEISEPGFFDQSEHSEPSEPAIEQVSFRHSPSTRPSPRVAPEPEAETDVALEPQAEARPAPQIPPTPDVPMKDPADDAPGYPGVPGVAARVVTTRRANLRPHRDTLSEVVRKLKDIRDRRA